MLNHPTTFLLLKALVGDQCKTKCAAKQPTTHTVIEPSCREREKAYYAALRFLTDHVNGIKKIASFKHRVFPYDGQKQAYYLFRRSYDIRSKQHAGCGDL